MFLSAFIGVVSISVVEIPLMVILFFTYLRSSDFKKKIFILIFALYLSAVFSAVGIPTINDLHLDITLNYIPFIDAANSINSYLRNVILNAVMFIPIGFLLPYIWKDYISFKRIFLYGFCLSLFIEISQLFTFRITDTDDLISNTIGCILGFLLYKVIFRKRHNKLHFQNKVNGTEELFFITVVIFVIMFFIAPFIPIADAIWGAFHVRIKFN